MIVNYSLTVTFDSVSILVSMFQLNLNLLPVFSRRFV